MEIKGYANIYGEEGSTFLYSIFIYPVRQWALDRVEPKKGSRIIVAGLPLKMTVITKEEQKEVDHGNQLEP